MSQVKIEALLLEKIGLAPNAISSNAIARAVSRRRLACELPDLQTYLQRLQVSTAELEELIEEVVVPETSFFRDRQPFTFLESHVKSEWLKNPNRGILRILSVPCSSGEEPYSIAITLINAGLIPNQFCIDAVDISKKALHKAKNAIYSNNSFRGNDLPAKKDYFQQTSDGYQLCQLVCNTVNFIRGNILEASFLSDRKYDIIFCRNLLIYFNSDTCLRVIDILNNSLTSQGLLFVGSAETGMIPLDRFGSVRYPFSFAYRQLARWQSLSARESTPINTPRSIETTKHKDRVKASSRSNDKLSSTTSSGIKSEREVLKLADSLPDLQTIRNLADRGNLDEATRLCKHYSEHYPASAQAYLLLGELHQAVGDKEQAERWFEKAIYLEPNYYEALMHLTLLKEHLGDISGATVLHRRIQRLDNLNQ